MKNIQLKILVFLFVSAVSGVLFGMDKEAKVRNKLTFYGEISIKAGGDIFYASQASHDVNFGKNNGVASMPIVSAHISIYQNQTGKCLSMRLDEYCGVDKQKVGENKTADVLLRNLLKQDTQGNQSFVQVGDTIYQEYEKYILALQVVESSLSDNMQQFIKQEPKIKAPAEIPYLDVVGELQISGIVEEVKCQNGEIVLCHGSMSYLKKCGLLEPLAVVNENKAPESDSVSTQKRELEYKELVNDSAKDIWEIQSSSFSRDANSNVVITMMFRSKMSPNKPIKLLSYLAKDFKYYVHWEGDDGNYYSLGMTHYEDRLKARVKKFELRQDVSKADDSGNKDNNISNNVDVKKESAKNLSAFESIKKHKNLLIGTAVVGVVIGAAKIMHSMYYRSPQYGQEFIKYLLSFKHYLPEF